MANSYNNLGFVFQAKGEWGKAIEYFQKALDICERFKNIHGLELSQTYIGLGVAIFLAKGEADKAIEYFQKA
jgi:tetratricopeptide (TPR) repeat protein